MHLLDHSFAQKSSVSSYSFATATPLNYLLCSFVYVCKAAQKYRGNLSVPSVLGTFFWSKNIFCAIFLGAILVSSTGAHCQCKKGYPKVYATLTPPQLRIRICLSESIQHCFPVAASSAFSVSTSSQPPARWSRGTGHGESWIQTEENSWHQL